MPVDKVIDSTAIDATFTAIANAIRNKNGASVQYTPEQMVEAITAIQVNGGDGDTSFKDVIERTATNPVLPMGLTKIRNYAFYAYANLALTSLPSGLTTIGTYAFYSCTNLALTLLPEGITSISSNAFYGCTNLALTSLPSGLTSIGGSAFDGCTSLALTALPSGITKIDYYAFRKCNALTTLTFLGKPNTINSSAFSGCSNLTSIRVPWGEGEVRNAPWGATNATITYNYTGGV